MGIGLRSRGVRVNAKGVRRSMSLGNKSSGTGANVAFFVAPKVTPTYMVSLWNMFLAPRKDFFSRCR